jgi:TonB family protein
MFSEVRKSVLPGLAQRAYADAKAAFDRKDADTTDRFERVLLLLRDPDVAADPALADLATVAIGFRDLSKASSPAPVATSAPSAVSPRRATAAPASTGVIVPPSAISQPFPPLQLREAREWDGEVEVVIDPSGKVVSARMTKSIHPQYDAVLLRAAKGWTYQPATKDGVPTQMVKLVTVHLDSRPVCGPRVRGDCRPIGQ